MKLIIDIPEETYEYWKEHKYEYVLAEAIANGIPLPKRHGRLVDENHVIAELVYRKNLLADNVTCGQVTEIFDSAVVVEADMENNDETVN